MISGFSIIKNGESLGYPWKESLLSLAPLVDEIVLAHGDSTDSTAAAIEDLKKSLPCPLRVIDSPWDAQNTKKGLELSRQSNIALSHCKHDTCFYIQADELVHEAEYERIKTDIRRFEADDAVDALAFQWIHFFGNFQTVVHSKRWYRREIRVVKKRRQLQSYGDAQGFRIFQNETWSKPNAALSQAHILHYGWVRPPQVMAKKSEALDKLWHGNARDGKHSEENVYPVQFGLQKYSGTHPSLMNKRITELGDFDPFQDKAAPRHKEYWKLYFTHLIESATGWRPGEYSNYKSIKRY